MLRGIEVRRLALVVLAVLLLAGPLVQGALASKELGKYHWGRQDREFTLEVGDNVSRRWDRYLDRSAREWNRSDVVRPDVVKGSTKPARCEQTDGRVEVCSGFYGSEEDRVNWLGITRIFYDGRDHITAATVKLNDSYFISGKYDTSEARRHTVCHELGHAFGLDHVNTSSCMNDSEQAIFDNLKPTRRDFRTLKRKYNHRDQRCEVTVGDPPDNCGGRRVNVESGEEGGGFFDIEQLPNATTGPADNHTRTVEELPDGRTMVTYVSWAD